jgi:hypothetical protein
MEWTIGMGTTLPAMAGQEVTAFLVPPETTGRMGATAATSRFRLMTSSSGSTSPQTAARGELVALEGEVVPAERVETVAFRPIPATRTVTADREAMAAKAAMEGKEARAEMAAISSSPPRRSQPALFMGSRPVGPEG